MEPQNRSRDTAWPLCGRNDKPLGRRTRARPRSIRQHERPHSTPATEPGFLQQLETLQGAVGKLSRNLEGSRAIMASAATQPPPQPRLSTTVPEKAATSTVPSHCTTTPSPNAVATSKQSPTLSSQKEPKAPVNPAKSLQHTSALWQHYLDRVDPLLKIIDISTVQHLFISDISPEDIPKDVQSLKSAVLFAAAASMQRPFGTTCPIAGALVKRHSREVEDSLAASRFLANPTVVVLQALTIYLTCGGQYLDQTYIWSMTAILVRLATALKLHRDPEGQGLPFADCEYRRRLWWHICTLDAQTSEANQTDPLIYERQCTTRVPEWSTDPACPPYLKDMFFSAVRSEITYYSRTILFSNQFTQDNGYPVLPSSGKLCIIEALEETLREKYFRRCDQSLPAYKLAVTSSKITIARLKLAVLYQKDDVESYMNDEVDQILRACVEVMEGMRSFRADPSLSMWAWLWQSYADWDAAETCLSVITQNNSSSSEMLSRACSATESFFDSWTDSVFETSRQEQWTRLKQLRAQAEVPHPFTSIKARSRRNSKALTLVDSPLSNERSPDLTVIDASIPDAKRSMTLPIEWFASSKKRQRKTRSGDSISRNWSMPICSQADEMHFDLKALDLHGSKSE